MGRMLPQVMTAEPWTTPPGDGDERRVHVRRAARAGAPGRAAGLVPGGVPRGHGRARRAPRRPRPERPEHWEFDRRARAGHGLRGRRRAPRRRALAEVLVADAENGVDARAPAARRGAGRRPRPLRLLRRHRPARDRAAPASSRAPATASPTAPAGGASVATGEVLLGYPDEDGTLPAAPRAPFDRNGTFVVYRKLAMDAAAFRRFVAERELPRRAGAAGGQDRRPLARRHAAGGLARTRPDAAIVRRPARASTTSATPTTRTACAARSARTSAAPTRATRRASSAAG